MSQENGEYSEQTHWEAYSNFQHVSKRMASAIDDAVMSFTTLKAAQTENAGLKPTQYARHKRNILAAAMMLQTELEQDKDSKEEFEEILARWQGENNSGGYITQLSQTSVRSGLPPFLEQMVSDIRRAGWELGYLRAGRKKREGPQNPVEREAKDMFSDL